VRSLRWVGLDRQDRPLIEELQVRATANEELHRALDGKVVELTAVVDGIPAKIAEAVKEAKDELEAQMDVMRGTISAQASRIQLMENIETQRCHHAVEKRKKKEEFWANKKPSVMANLRGMSKVPAAPIQTATRVSACKPPPTPVVDFLCRWPAFWAPRRRPRPRTTSM
jgi:hypothetical protein